MPHLSELHGAATHLAVVAVPVYLLILAGVTGLLVWGQAQTMLRGNSFRIGTAHFWLLGIPLGVVESAGARSDALARLEREADGIAAAVDDRTGARRAWTHARSCGCRGAAGPTAHGAGAPSRSAVSS